MNIGHLTIKFPVITSTNDFALSFIEKNMAVNGMVVTAEAQIMGKGQDQNQWESFPGKNLTISIVINPQGLKPVQQFMLNKITSLAVRDFIQSQSINAPISIKWPNDIYIGNKKIAGILISNIISGQELLWSVIGIGVNINQTEFFEAPNPVSLKQISGKNYNLKKCLQNLLNAFKKRLKQLIEFDFEHIDSDYLDALYRVGINSKFIYKNHEIEAIITGIGEFGNLELTTQDGERISCDQREIKFIINSLNNS